MSNEYSPVPGDSVKLVGKANPDNVLYGDFRSMAGEFFAIFIDGIYAYNAFNFNDWTITPWTRPVAFKPFAVVRLPEGWNQIIWPSEIIALPRSQASRTSDDFWEDSGYQVNVELTDEEVATLLNHGAEILFEGVDDA